MTKKTITLCIVRLISSIVSSSSRNIASLTAYVAYGLISRFGERFRSDDLIFRLVSTIISPQVRDLSLKIKTTSKKSTEYVTTQLLIIQVEWRMSTICSDLFSNYLTPRACTRQGNGKY